MARPSLGHPGSIMSQHQDDGDDASIEGIEDEEADACLGDDNKLMLSLSPATLPVYMTIHRNCAEGKGHVLTLLELSVRRLVLASIVYCLLANRVSSLRDTSKTVHQSINVARATLCELVATRVLRRFHEDNAGPQGLLLLAHILVEGVDPFQGAPSEEVLGGERVEGNNIHSEDRCT
ncbi:hypothetical protein G7046_g4336 [Stylonectria norvegica]|nr:hypothetical protein G7046_g4336 [Stylonectria norvegica]